MARRPWIYHQLDPAAWEGRNLSPTNSGILVLVLLSIIAAVLQSEPKIQLSMPSLFQGLTGFFAIAFTIEYAVRLWAMGEDPQYSGLKGRIRYICTFFSFVDLVATLLLWFDLLIGFAGIYGVMFRIARALRIISLTRNSEVAIAIGLLGAAIRSRALELLLSFAFAALVLLISATLLFFVEGEVQPEAFGSIPRAMWWAMATLTTVGYGDVYPSTASGQVLASIVALTSIAIVAMPTGIMAAAFSDAFQDLRKQEIS